MDKKKFEFLYVFKMISITLSRINWAPYTKPQTTPRTPMISASYIGRNLNIKKRDLEENAQNSRIKSAALPFGRILTPANGKKNSMLNNKFR